MISRQGIYGQKTAGRENDSLGRLSRHLNILDISKPVTLEEGNGHSQLSHILDYNSLSRYNGPVYHCLSAGRLDAGQLSGHISIPGTVGLIGQDGDPIFGGVF